MKKLTVLLFFTIIFSLNAYSLLDVYNNPKLNINSSFNQHWVSNFGDSLDLRLKNDENLTAEMRQMIISRIFQSNNSLRSENQPYIEKKDQIQNQIELLSNEIPAMEKDLNDFLITRNLLIIKKSMTEGSSQPTSTMNDNRRDIYRLGKRIHTKEYQLSELKHQLGHTRRFLNFNNLQIRRNNMRIAYLGGFTHEKTAEIIPEIPEMVQNQSPPPLVDPATLAHYSMAAMEGFELDKCPKHNEELEYTLKMIEDSYRGIKYSYPLYAGWCPTSNTAFIFREAEDTSKKVVIEIRNRKMKQIDEMLKKS